MLKVSKLLSEYPPAPSAEEVQQELTALLQNISKYDNLENLKKIFSLIDLTSLNSFDQKARIEQMADQVNNFKSEFADVPNVAAICVYPPFVNLLKKELVDKNIQIASVCASFPSSQTFLSVKKAECLQTIKSGANELDIVISIGTFLEGSLDIVFNEIAEIKKIAKKPHLKVILETGALKTPERIYSASLLAMEAGADFIKTSTGKLEPAATLEAMLLMCKAIKLFNAKKNKKIGIKPAGGISTFDEALKYFTLVAEVLGEEYLNNSLFRIGASKLANNILSKIKGAEIDYFGEKPFVKKVQSEEVKEEKEKVAEQSKKIKKEAKK